MKKGKRNLTSRLMIDDTCSISAGILNIISEVDPFCFTWSFSCQDNHSQVRQAKNRTRGGGRRPNTDIHSCVKRSPPSIGFTKTTKEPRIDLSRRRRPRSPGTNAEVGECRHIGFSKFAGSGPRRGRLAPRRYQEHNQVQAPREMDPIMVRGDGKEMGGIWMGENEKEGREGDISEQNRSQQRKNQVGGVKFSGEQLEKERKRVLTLSDNWRL